MGSLELRDVFFGSCINAAGVRFYLDWVADTEWLGKADGNYEGAKVHKLPLSSAIVVHTLELAIQIC